MKKVVADEMDTWRRILFFSTSDAYLYYELYFKMTQKATFWQKWGRQKATYNHKNRIYNNARGFSLFNRK